MKVTCRPFAVERRRTRQRAAFEKLGELFGILTEVDGAERMEGICNGEKFTAIVDKSKRWGSNGRQWSIYKRGLARPCWPARSLMSALPPKTDK